MYVGHFIQKAEKNYLMTIVTQTMIKFSTFETTVNYIYQSIGKPKDQLSSLAQTGVSFAGGYIAGIFCAIGSHPADVMVSKLNADRKGIFTRLPPMTLQS